MLEPYSAKALNNAFGIRHGHIRINFLTQITHGAGAGAGTPERLCDIPHTPVFSE